jgi:hypothetical protein
VPEDAGALLVRSGLIASDQLRIARQAQAGRGGTIGEHLVLAGFIDDEALAEFYRSRLMVPQVKPEQLSNIPDWLIAKIPAEMAAQFRCVPVACEPDRHLTLAMADPSTTHAVDEISFFTGHYVVRAVATQRQIAWCLARYYGQVTPLVAQMTREPDDGTAGLPSSSASGARAPEPGGPVARAAGGGSAPAQAPQPRADARPEPGAGQSGRLPLPAPTDEDLDEDMGAAVPMVIENDRPSPPPRPPYIPPESREPMISFLHEETAPTGPMRLLQRRPTTQPPELRDRAGEFEVPTGPIQRLRPETLPPVVISPLLADPDRVPTERSPRLQLRPVESREVAERDADYLPPEVLELPPPPSAGEPRPLPPAPPVSPAAGVAAGAPGTSAGAAGDASAPAAQATGAQAPSPAPGNPDDLVLLDRPKGDRRRHRRTRLGLGIAPSTLSRLTGTPDSIPGTPGVAGRVRTWSLPATRSRTPARGAAGAAGTTARGSHVDDGVPAAVGSTHEGVPGGELEPEHSMPTAAPDEPTGPVRVRDTGTARWPRPAAVTGSADSIQAAALAAAEALRDAPQRQADASGPRLTPVPGDVSMGVPNVVMDETPSADTQAQGASRPAPRAQAGYHGEELDDPRWGPPGSTIPPQFLGPLEYEVQDSGPSPVPLLTEHLPEEVSDADIDQVLNAGFDAPGASGGIPVYESAPVRARQGSPGPASSRSTALTPAEVPATAMVAPPVTGPVLAFQAAEPMTPDLVQALEDSSLRLVEILRELDQADDRNAVVDTLIQHLAESHQRVAFFVVKSGELTSWKQRLGQEPIERRDGIKLNLDEPSTFQDIVGTRLPFRGPLTDPVSRAFVAAALGFSASEMLALPVAVRGRVVGILYGDTETRRVFEQHLAVVTRAAGVALERILRARKGQ